MTDDRIDKNFKIIITSVFHLSKKLKEKLHMLRRDIKDIFKNCPQQLSRYDVCEMKKCTEQDQRGLDIAEENISEFEAQQQKLSKKAKKINK